MVEDSHWLHQIASLAAHSIVGDCHTAQWPQHHPQALVNLHDGVQSQMLFYGDPDHSLRFNRISPEATINVFEPGPIATGVFANIDVTVCFFVSGLAHE